MTDGDRRERTVLVDASVFITLAAVDAVDYLLAMEGSIVVPERVADELSDEQSAAALDRARERGRVDVERATENVTDAGVHLGSSNSDASGDVGLLAHALGCDEVVAVTDDKPLRKVCKALSIPVTGSIAVVVRAVERGDLDPGEANGLVYAMDEVGARLSASLVRRAERLIEDASEE